MIKRLSTAMLVSLVSMCNWGTAYADHHFTEQAHRVACENKELVEDITELGKTNILAAVSNINFLIEHGKCRYIPWDWRKIIEIYPAGKDESGADMFIVKHEEGWFIGWPPGNLR